jgi:hypothetical protein
MTDLERKFEAWWAAYPRKVGKGAARPKFKAAMRKVEYEVLMAATERFAAIMSGRERQWIPHPATFLYGERWLDEDLQDVVLAGNIPAGWREPTADELEIYMVANPPGTTPPKLVLEAKPIPGYIRARAEANGHGQENVVRFDTAGLVRRAR